MNSLRKRFYDAKMYAEMNSDCDDKVGIIWVPNGYNLRSRIFESVRACNKDGYSAELNLITEVAKFKDVKGFEDITSLLSDGSVWITKAPDYNCSINLIKYGLNEINYCEVDEIADEVQNIFDCANVRVNHYSEFKFENDDLYPCWLNEFYENAYEIVKHRIAPLTIISYNNPKVPALEYLGYGLKNVDKYPCIVFVRESQKEMYYNEIGHYDMVSIVGLPDELVWNAGATRRESQKWLYNNGYTMAFQIDDDIEGFCHAIPDIREDGNEKTGYYPADSGRIFAMWQIAMEKAIAGTNGRLMLSGGMPIGFSFKNEYKMSEWSCCLNYGALTQFVCWNVKGMVENNLFYRDNPDVGLDDIDMTLRIIENGFLVCGFPWAIYSCAPMGNQSQYIDGDYRKPGPELIKRFEFNQEKLKENHGFLPWLKFREKRRLPQTCIYWVGARKWCVEKGFLKSNNYKHDIWNDGKLLEEASQNKYSVFEDF